MRTKISVMAIVMTVMVAGAAFAGSLDAPAAPTSATSAMFTLEDVYQRLATGAAGTKRPGPFAEPGAGPASTGHTLDEVMSKAPAVDNTNGATAGDVMSGKTFWGLTGGAWGLQPGTGTIATVPAPVSKTGDSTDGATGVNFPNPRFTVTDNLTGLMWLKNANLANTVAYNPDSTGNGSVQWSNANALVASLNAGTAPFAGKNCGYTDWRLPTLRELQSLIHYGYVNPALSNTVGTDKWAANDPFDSVQAGNYWSATTYAGSTALAWFVTLYDGFVFNDDKTITDYVWPVR